MMSMMSSKTSRSRRSTLHNTAAAARTGKTGSRPCGGSSSSSRNLAEVSVSAAGAIKG